MHSTPEVDPADEVSPVYGDELLESRGVLVVEGGGKILQGNFKLFTQWGAGVKTEAAGRIKVLGNILKTNRRQSAGYFF